MMLSPAMQPEAIGIVYMSFHFGAFFSRIQTISAPRNMAKLVEAGMVRAMPSAAGEGV